MQNTNVELVKRFVLGEGADQRSHLRMAHEKMIARRVDTPTARERRVDGSFDVVDPEVTIRIPESMPYGGVHVGPEGFARVAQAMNETWRLDGELEVSFHSCGEDQVVEFLSWTGVSRHTGRSLPVRMVAVYTIRNSRIIEMEFYYWDTAEIVAATGGVKTL